MWRELAEKRADALPEAIDGSIGDTALVRRNPRAAEQAFREAVRLDPQAVEAWAMIVRILVATGDRNGGQRLWTTHSQPIGRTNFFDLFARSLPGRRGAEGSW